jgi:ATP-dependent Clp protease ATP-binding subunit ClpB
LSSLSAAIDLVDEAAAKLKMEITSKPIELDEVDREIIRLEMEKLSLKNDTDKASKERLSKLETELESLKQKQKNLSEHWEYEKSLMTRIRSVKEEVRACVIFCLLIIICRLYIFLPLHHGPP